MINSLASGSMLAQYRLISVLGRGSFGITYKAEDTLLNRMVAIKEYAPKDLTLSREQNNNICPITTELAEFQMGLTEFLHEARTLAQFNNDNIVRILSVLEQHNTAYIVMELLDGQTLQQHLVDIHFIATMPESRIKTIANAILTGLEQIHANGLLHLDIKTSNIFLTKDNKVILIDFGSSKTMVESSHEQTTSLSLYSAAPEQFIKGKTLTAATDFYALGCLLYYLIVGQPAPSARQRLKQVQNGQESLPTIPKGDYHPSIIELVYWCLALKPSNRPQSVEQIRAKLAEIDDYHVPSQDNNVTRKLQSNDVLQSPRLVSQTRIWLAALIVISLIVVSYQMFFEARPKDGADVAKATSDRLSLKSQAENNVEQQTLQPEPQQGPAESRTIAEQQTEQATLAEQDTSAEQDNDVAPQAIPEDITWLLNEIEANLTLLPAGEFMMGSNNGADNEKPVHRESVAGFYILSHEVTQAMYQVCVKYNVCRSMSYSTEDAERAAHSVSWLDITNYFLPWLNQYSQFNYRLPTEAEWEYAARAGQQTNYSWGDHIGQAQAVCDGCGSRWDNRGVAPIKSFESNGFGLYDMHGNVAEWTQNCWQPYATKYRVFQAECDYSAVKGGAWSFRPSHLRLASRKKTDKKSISSAYGFRLARDK